MGIEYNAARAILVSKLNGAKLGKTITIGRQGLYENKKILKKLFKKFNITIDNSILSGKYAEKLLLSLGATNVSSMDYSDYEGATFIHDMNKPINNKFKNNYDFVFDGGSLEHIFNFPVAIKNCMEMLKINGYFISVTTCNNFSGHGFYQFSPELFFRIFTKENGYRLDGIFISENKKWYKVKDPKIIKSRVTFKNNSETYIIVIAKKMEQKNIFSSMPQQNDYVEIWNSRNDNVKENILEKIPRKIRQIYHKYFIKYDKRFFNKINL